MTESVFSYTNYRFFLRDRLTAKKRLRRHWSVRRWSRELGLASPSMLTMILNGSRNPGEDLTERFCKALGLEGKEESYFRDLIELERSSHDPRIAFHVMERLARQRPNGEFRQLSRAAFQAISRWYCYAIREMVSLPSFREDSEWIASRLQFQVTPAEVKDAIHLLLKVGLLVRGADGKLQCGGGHYETQSDIADEGIKRFHEQALDNARRSLRQHDTGLREFHGTTLAISRDKLPEAKSLVRKFHKEFRELLESSRGDSVYHVEVALFPVAMEGGE